MKLCNMFVTGGGRKQRRISNKIPNYQNSNNKDETQRGNSNIGNSEDTEGRCEIQT